MPQPSSNRRQPEAAPDEYQAPFTLPSRKAAQNDGHTGAANGEMASSPFFDDAERAEAMEWANSSEAVEDGDADEGDAGGAIAIKRGRRDSQVSSYGDVGSVFDGPAAGAVPSSVSSMRHSLSRPELSRKASARARRRISRDGHSRSYNRDDDDAVDAMSDAASAVSGRDPSIHSAAHSSRIGRKRRVPEADADSEPRGMLGSLLASITGGGGDRERDDDDARSRSSRRPGLVRRRSSQSSIGSRGRATSSRGSEAGYSDDEGSGFDLEYGTDDDDEDDSGDSMHSGSSDEDGGILPSAFGPLSGAVDPVFGDSRISAGHEPEDELDEELQNASGIHRDVEAAQPTDVQEELRKAREEMSFLDKASRTRQQIYLPDEDTLIRLKGYRVVAAQRIIWIILCVVSLGILYLIGRWLPRLWLKWTCKEADFERAEFVIVENQYGDLLMVSPETVPFARPLATAFPPSSRDPPSTLAEHQAAVATQAKAATNISQGGGSKGGSAINSARSSIKNGKNGVVPTGNGSLMASDELQGLMSGVETEQLMDLTLITYRYTRFFLHPPTGRFRMVKDWRDPAWVSNANVSSGNSWDAEKDRMALFGKNEIEIEDKGVVGLLVDEVLHPFYSE